MTIVLTQVTRLGVTMVADSAITSAPIDLKVLPSGKDYLPFVRVGAEKIIPIPGKPIGISFWGMGRMGHYPSDVWLKDLAESKLARLSTLAEVADEIAKAANDIMFSSKQDEKGGFHVAGIVKAEDGNALPVAYHVHRGPDAARMGPFQVHRDIPDGQGFTTVDFRTRLRAGEAYFLFNGHHEQFRHLFVSMRDHLYKLREYGMLVPYPSTIQAQAELAKLYVGTMCDIYALSNVVQSVARPISSLTIELDGSVRYERPLATAG